MPKLVFIGLCEKPIVNRDDSTLTLVTLIEEVTVSFDPDGAPEPEVIADRPTYLVTSWLANEGDSERQFEQVLEFCAPNGDVAMDRTVGFTIPARAHKIIARFPGIPIGEQGECIIRTSLRQLPDGEPKLFHEYPVLVKHEPKLPDDRS